MEKHYEYSEILENGTIFKFNKTGLDYDINGELPVPFFETDDFTILKLQRTIIRGFIDCIILFHDGSKNYNHVLWYDIKTTFLDMIYTTSIDEKSYIFCTKKGLVQAIPDYFSDPEQTLVDFGNLYTLKELDDCFSKLNYKVIEINNNTLAGNKVTFSEIYDDKDLLQSIDYNGDLKSLILKKQFLINFTRGIKIPSWRIEKFDVTQKYNKGKATFVMNILEGEKPEEIMQELHSFCHNEIDFSVSYMNKVGQEILKYNYFNFKITSLKINICGDYTSNESLNITIKMTKNDVIENEGTEE